MQYIAFKTEQQQKCNESIQNRTTRLTFNFLQSLVALPQSITITVALPLILTLTSATRSCTSEPFLLVCKNTDSTFFLVLSSFFHSLMSFTVTTSVWTAFLHSEKATRHNRAQVKSIMARELITLLRPRGRYLVLYSFQGGA